MMKQTTALDINIYPPEAQGVGQFDGGRITEIKPIGFPQDGPVSPHLGPLFYWAWASAKGYGKIGLHPHQAFEIMSYALEGEIGHADTLGTKSRVKAGGAQVMQTGSGVSHEEETVGDRTEFFQIWFEPNLREAVLRPPTYREFANEDFPVAEKDGVRIKSVLGDGAPITLVAEAAMQDVVIQPGHRYQRELGAGRTLALMVIDGNGVLIDEANQGKHYLEPRYFSVVHARERGTVSLQAEGDQALRAAIIEVPATVDYPLYRNGR
jgi:redox-sensitive bicupin YhaK (pirin superfamily)